MSINLCQGWSALEEGLSGPVWGMSEVKGPMKDEFKVGDVYKVG